MIDFETLKTQVEDDMARVGGIHVADYRPVLFCVQPVARVEGERIGRDGRVIA